MDDLNECRHALDILGPLAVGRSLSHFEQLPWLAPSIGNRDRLNGATEPRAG
jgi:hypothetical protein